MILTHGRWYIYYDPDYNPHYPSMKTPYLISFKHSLYVYLQMTWTFYNLTETCWEFTHTSHVDYRGKGHNCRWCEENRSELKENLCEECFNEIKTDQHAAIFSIDVFHKSCPIRVHVYNSDNFNITINNTDYYGWIEHIAWYDEGCIDYYKIYRSRFAYIMWLVRELGDVRLMIVSDMIQLSENIREKINEIQRINDLP